MRHGNLQHITCGLIFTCAIGLLSHAAQAETPWVVYEGKEGLPGHGKHIVLVSGDEEYRSEEALPMLGQILAVRHGFKCTVLFAVNPQDGTIDPNNQNNIPGLEALDQADMMIIATRFRQLPDEQMKHVDAFVKAGKPIMGLRTATHAFAYKTSDSPYAKYSFNSSEWPGGFGRQVLGETWINHHGHHRFESTRGVVNERFADHPILKGVQDVWGPTDVYGIRNLTEDAKVLMHGQVLEGMAPTDKPVAGEKNNPMMPLVWIKDYQAPGQAQPSRIVCTTMGASVDLASEDLRRLLVNACYWALGLEEQIPDRANVDYVRPYEPSFYGNNGFKKNMKPSDYAL